MAGETERRLILITGGSASGKSQLAEQYACKAADEAGLLKYYLATMKIRDAEMARKVRRHKERRAGKGWQTIECPVDIAETAAEALHKRYRSCLALLECMSNLTANEMFRDGMIFPAESTVKKILSDVNALQQQCRILIIVTNEVFSDGIQYDEATMEYMRALGRINTMLAAEADEVYEAVAGIPVRLK